MKQQATRANPAQIAQHIRRQRAGVSGLEFAHAHPVIDALCGAIILAAGVGGMVGMWIKVGAGV